MLQKRMLMSESFALWMQEKLLAVEQTLLTQIPPATQAPTDLHEGMRYGVLDGGKRVRPLLVCAAAQAVTPAVNSTPHFLESACNLAASSVELIHAYSLIHDDMPCMDNDVLRRGKPTVHVAFGEAGAMLAGDALQPLAFEFLTRMLAHGVAPEVIVNAVSELARASGSLGMAGGQAMDLKAVGRELSLDELRRMHELKTGALLRASVHLGAMVVAGPEWNNGRLPLEYAALDSYGRAMGLAFQVIDDVLDIEADTATLGKTAGKDVAQNKPTYVSLMGLETARRYAHDLLSEALDAISPLGERANRLRQMAELIVLRNS
jgi:farnesyl diphosphate synthase